MCVLYIKILGSVPFLHVGPELVQLWTCYVIILSKTPPAPQFPFYVSCIKKSHQLFIHIVSCLKLAEEPRYLSGTDWRAKDSNTCFSAPFPQSQATVCSQVRGRGSSVQTQLVDPHHLNICFTLAPQCVHTLVHACSHSQVEKVLAVFFLLSAAQRGGRRDNKNKGGRKEERGDEGARGLECFEQRWVGRALERACGPRDGVIGRSQMGHFPSGEKVMCGLDGNNGHADTLCWLTQQTHILAMTHKEAAATIKATWSKLVPADTSHAHTHTVNLPVTTHASSPPSRERRETSLRLG